MEVAASVSWWKRLLFAFLATLTLHLLNTCAFAALLLRDFDPHNAYPIRSELQSAALFFILGGYFVLALFFLLGVPLALFIPVRLQLRHRFGMLLAATLLPLLLFATIGANSAISIWHNLGHRNWFGGYIALCGLVTGVLYLWLIHRAARADQAQIRISPTPDLYKM